MKKLILFILAILITAFGVMAYTAPNFTSVDLVLGGSYTAPNFTSVDLVLGEAITQCSNTINTDWIITDAQICDNQELNIGTGNIIITTGNLTLINGANVTANGTRIMQNGDKIFISGGSKLITK